MEPAPGGDETTIRVLTLNAHQGLRAGHRHGLLPRIRNALRASRADLVFLQEIGAVAGPEPHVHQYEILADGVWTQHAYGRNAVAMGGHHGNALLSRHPITTWRNVDASVGRAEPRGLLHAVVGLDGDREPLHAICVHLALRESHRRRQIDRLLDLVVHEIPDGAPLVIAGDFNDWRERAHRRLVLSGLEEVHAAAVGRPARTFPARAPWLRLDRIYVRNVRHRPVKVSARDWRMLSDHLPLAAELGMGACGFAAARPRPFERSDSADGGPLWYRVGLRVRIDVGVHPGASRRLARPRVEWPSLWRSREWE